MAGRIKFSYEEGQGGVLRPYLWLNLYAKQRGFAKVRGLLDTGADVSLLGLEDAQLLGLTPDDLEDLSARGPAGEVPGQRARSGIRVVLPGASGGTALRPIFMEGGLGARWGRDFMANYGVAFDERTSQFSLFVWDAGPDSDLTP